MVKKEEKKDERRNSIKETARGFMQAMIQSNDTYGDGREMTEKSYELAEAFENYEHES